jgi:hypothetical protein
MFSRQPPFSPPLSRFAKAARTEESPISSLMAMASHNPSLISFAAGLVDAPTLPVERCAAITRRIDTGIQGLGKVVGELLETTPMVPGDSPGCGSLNPEPRTLSHE